MDIDSRSQIEQHIDSLWFYLHVEVRAESCINSRGDQFGHFSERCLPLFTVGGPFETIFAQEMSRHFENKLRQQAFGSRLRSLAGDS